MKLKKTLATGLTAAALMVPSLANAGIDFVFNWGATGEGAFGGITTSDPLNPVRSMKFTAESAIVFDGVPFTPGVTFTDYVVLRVDQLFNSASAVVGPYGDTGVPGFFDMGITVLAEFTGIQNTALTYSITGSIVSGCSMMVRTMGTRPLISPTWQLLSMVPWLKGAYRPPVRA